MKDPIPVKALLTAIKKSVSDRPVEASLDWPYARPSSRAQLRLDFLQGRNTGAEHRQEHAHF